MTTYDGRAYSFQPGKDVVNKEPPVSKFVVEKLYKVHRERILNIQPLVDCHVHIPDFLTDQTWKEAANEHRKNVIASRNEVIYQRIAKRANEESGITKASREHMRRVNEIKGHTKRLKEAGRLRKVFLIQRENEMMMQRIQRVQPEYTLKSMKEWYKHHTLFKEGRRSDPTAGHIMRNVKKELRPAILAKGEKSYVDSAVQDSLSRGLNKNSLVSNRSMTAGSKVRSKYNSSSGIQSAPSLLVNDVSHQIIDADVDLYSPDPHRDNIRRVNTAPAAAHTPSHKLETSTDIEGKSHFELNDFVETESISITSSFYDKLLQEIDATESQSNVLELDSHVMTITTHVLPVKNESYNVSVSAFYDPKHSEDITFRIFALNGTRGFLNERNINIGKIKDFVSATVQKSQRFGSVTLTDDMFALREFLVSMFLQADNDGSGFLAFDEFETLMIKLDIGITARELRNVICEADENQNGVVEFEEFVPLAIDLIQSFRCRQHAHNLVESENLKFDEIIAANMNKVELESISKAAIEKIKALDSHNFGMIRKADLLKVLIAVSPMGLTENEIGVVPFNLNQDSHGRYYYAALFEGLLKARYHTKMAEILTKSGDPLLIHLLKLFSQEELSMRREHDPDITDHDISGMLPVKSVQNILQGDEKIGLSRLQVIIIMSDARQMGSNNNVDYYQFAPIIARTVDLMNEPKLLRQRAEIIGNCEFNVDSLLQLGKEELHKKLTLMHQCFDIDNNGLLSTIEFRRALISLEFELVDTEIDALFVTSEGVSNGAAGMNVDEFCHILEFRILLLEKQKHVRLAKKLIHSTLTDKTHSHDTICIDIAPIASHLNDSFKYFDRISQEPISLFDIQYLMIELDIKLPDSEIQRIFDRSFIDGNFRFELMIEILGEILKSYIAKQLVEIEVKEKMELVSVQADKMIRIANDEIVASVKYLYHRVKLIEKTVSTTSERIATVKNVLKNRQLGFSENEIEDISQSIFIHHTLDDDHGHNPHRRKSNASSINLPVHLPHAESSGNLALNHDSHSNHHSNHNASAKHHGSQHENSDSDYHSASGKHHGNHNDDNSSHHHSSHHSASGKHHESHHDKNHSGHHSASVKNHGSHNDDNYSSHHSASGKHHESHHDKNHSGHHSASVKNHGSHNDDNHSSHHHSSHHSAPVKHHGSHNDDNHSSHHSALGKQHGDHHRPKSLSSIPPYSEHENHHGGHGHNCCINCEDELFDIVVKIRKNSIVKHLLQNLNADSLEEALLLSTEAEMERLKGLRLIDERSQWIPASSLYNVLHQADIGLTNSTILAIIGWVECYDESHSCVDYKKFIKYAVGVITRLSSDGDLLDKRHEAFVNFLDIDHPPYLNGLTEGDIEEYFTSYFHNIQNADGEVTEADLASALSMTPKVNLSKKEVVHIMANAHKTKNHMINWKEFSEFAYANLRLTCRERTLPNDVMGEMAPVETKLQKKLRLKEEESLKQLHKQIEDLKEQCDLLLSMASIVTKGDYILLQLPYDNVAVENDDVSAVRNENDYREIELVSASSVKVGYIDKKNTIDMKIDATVRITFMEHNFNPTKKLHAYVQSSFKNIDLSDTIPVQLPSIAAIDIEAAKDFAMNIIYDIIVEKRFSDGALVLKVNL
jgi:Ca2+-binding EF-hand superfamily protein